jgi:glycosyltransferase involved in cell wall biosynthesis
MDDHGQTVGVIIIARNEGERLKRCLHSIGPSTDAIVYVDSGSTDGSVAFATILGVDVVRLCGSAPFTMGRARNEGFTHLRQRYPSIQLVQFIDGDCELETDWIQTARGWMEDHPEVAVVCGRRREKFPRASIYNMLCEIEWNTPVGAARACGGDAMVRVDFFERVGMFDPTLIAGEEPELCARIRSAGGGVYRLSENMTRHDAALFTFNAWWRRMSRCGYGAKAVVQRLSKRMPVNEVPFRDLTTSAVIWCDGWLTLLVFTALVAHASGVPKIPVGSTGGWLENALLALVVGLFVQALQCIRVAWLSRARGSPLNVLIYAVFLQIGKWPQRLGQLLWYRDNIVRKPARLIEYKT